MNRAVGGQGWWWDAACADADPELFFPVTAIGPSVVQKLEAKAVCARCPVAADCLDWALRTGQQAGIWGGLDETERRSLRVPALRKTAVDEVMEA